MKDKLEVGMYVRTEDDYIFKIKEILEKGKYNDSDNKIVQRFRIDGMYQKNEDYIETDYMYSDWIKKASNNVIDLIKPKDIILGKDGKLYQCWKVYKDYVFTYSKNKQGQTITLVDYQIDRVMC